jgi:Rho termination factor, N-terminal domain
MNPLSMETIFIILSGAILVAGVLYWLWSHIQLTQKKVQLLENAVFELRSMLAARGTEPPAPAVMVGGGGGPIVEDVIGSSAPAPAPVKQPSEYKDLDDDDWQEPAGNDVKSIPLVSTPLDVDDGHVAAPALVTQEVEAVNDDLMPGGRSSGVVSDDAAPQQMRELNLGDVGVAPRDDERFREFFKQPEASVSRSPESLESMPVKELRRLAEQRGIAGAADMRKKEILAALRQQITSVPAPAPAQNAEVTIEKEGADLGTTEAEILE